MTYKEPLFINAFIAIVLVVHTNSSFVRYMNVCLGILSIKCCHRHAYEESYYLFRAVDNLYTLGGHNRSECHIL